MTYISNDERSPDWYLMHFDGDVKVFLDGQEMLDVYEADDERGFIIQAKRDASGDIVVENDTIVTVRREGHVRLEGTRRTFDHVL